MLNRIPKRIFNGIIIIGILLCAGILRLNKLDQDSLWGDEACMVYLCQESIPYIVSALSSANRPDVDVAPPLYFICFHYWLHWFGDSLHAVRGFSLLFDVLCIGALFLYPGVILTNREKWFGSLLLTFSAFHIWYAQEARMYTFACFWGILSSVFFVRVFLMPKPQWFMGYILSSLGLLYSQYYGSLLLIAHGVTLGILWLLVRRAKSINLPVFKWFLISFLVILIGFIPWLHVLVRDFTFANTGKAGFPSKFSPLFTIPFLFAKYSVFGNEFFQRNNLWIYGVALVVFTPLFWRGIRHLGIIPLLFQFHLFIPIIIVYCGALVGLPVYKSHPFIIFSAFYYLILAQGAQQMGKWGARLIFLALVLNVIVLYSLNYSEVYTKPRVIEAIAWLEHHVHADEAIYAIPAAFPSPLPTMGDFLVWRYHTRNTDLKIIPVVVPTPEEFLDQLLATSSANKRITLLIQDNVLLQEARKKLFSYLTANASEINRTRFVSGMRDFTLDIVQYEFPKTP